MRIERFEAATITEAVVKAKAALGPNAVILQTQTSRKGGLFGVGSREVAEVVAATGLQVLRRERAGRARRRDSAKAARTVPASPLRANGQCRAGAKVVPGPGHVDTTERLDRQLHQLKRLITDMARKQDSAQHPEISPALLDFYNSLIKGEVATDLAQALVRRLHADLTHEQLKDGRLVRQRLRLYIARLIGRGAPIVLRPDQTTRIAFVGPTGVGKTTTIAKLAAIFKLREGRRVGLLTADTYRMAAIEQLRRYADLLNVPLRTAGTPADVARAIELFRGFDLILMDTAGRSHRNAARMAELKACLEAARPHETHLVLSITSRPSHLLSVVRRFDAVRVDRILFTKLDEGATFGPILSVAAGLGKSCSYLTTGQEVPDDIEVSRPDRVARLILGEEAA
jgi:flagellar biosynthesis protein FlhF